VLFWIPTLTIVAKILYVGTVILRGKEDPTFAGDKVIYRS
jgi:hypothetical protein